MVIVIMLAVVVAAVRFFPQSEEDEEPEHNHAESPEEGDTVKFFSEKFSHSSSSVEPNDRCTPEGSCECREGFLQEFH